MTGADGRCSVKSMIVEFPNQMPNIASAAHHILPKTRRILMHEIEEIVPNL
jgi:hypothetical protein